MSRRSQKRQVRNYLLDKSMQLRYVLFVTVFTGALAAALGYMVYAQERQASESIIRTLESSGFGPELRGQVVAQLGATDQNLVLIMGAVWLGMVVLLTLYLTVMTHKVAGPLFKVSRYFDEMAEGRLTPVYPLRKGDQLRDFYDKFKEMHDALRARQRKEIEAVGRFVQACEAAGVDRSGALGHRLEEARAHCVERDKNVT